MYLKSLSLKGFKSFADKATMLFEPGLTVIVGPNGSGKSNVSDAILWVLGEQSAKQLRGQAMEDVIFSGSTARKAVGLAEVVLVLDNSDKTLPIEFNELAITRRMYRSGESEYLINGSPARLRDIQDILHDSGLGKDTHSIISQGKLDEVLQSKPEERRSLIEEAAGISKHKKRKERSLKKVEMMDKHLHRAKDIQKEIKRQLKPLELQVDRAQQYNKLQKELKDAQTTLAVDALRNLRSEWQEVSKGFKERAAALELAEYRVQEKEKELSKLQVLLEERGLFVGDLAEQRRRMQSILAKLESNKRLLEEKGSNMVSRMSDLRASLHQSSKDSRIAREQFDEASKELEELLSREKALDESMQSLKQKSDDTRSIRIELDDKIQSVSNAISSSKQEADSCYLNLHKAKDALSNFELEDSLFENRVSQIEEQVQTDREELKQKRVSQENLQNEQAELKEGIEAQEREFELTSKAIAHNKALMEEHERELSRLKIQKNNFELQIESLENTNSLSKSLRTQFKNLNTQAHLFSELFVAPKELEDLLELALADELQALVTEGGFEASNLKQLKRETSGRAEIYALSKFKDASDAQVIRGAQSLLDLVELVSTDSSQLKSLLGSIYVLDSLDEALKLSEAHPSKIFLSKDFYRVERGGKITVLATSQNKSASKGVLHFKRELKQVVNKIPDLEALYDGAKKKFDESNEAYKASDDELRTLKEKLSVASAHLNSLASDIARLEQNISRGEAELSNIGERRDEARKKADEARPEIEKLEARSSELLKSIATLNQELSGLKDSRDSARSDERDASKNFNETKLELATLAERKKHISQRKISLENQIKRYEENHQVSEKTIMSLEGLMTRIDPLHEKLEELEAKAQSWAEKLKDKASLEEAGSSDLKKTISDAREAVLKQRQERDRMQALQADDKARQAALDVEVKQAIREIEQHSDLILEEALQIPAPQDQDALLKRLGYLEQEIQNIGPVNQVAMQQYSELKERADFIAKQVEDMQAAKSALTKIVNAIDRKMKTAFMDTYDKVNQNFQEIFSALFEGGKGHLELTDPDNAAESGIEVVAQPKGKRVSKMMLLSGGEKSLTALALLFAVYKTRTVPFYVLDEVEAALDGANLQRLLQALDILRKSTQLIVVSHQRQTMERANVLYGVSMQADGVSRVVSQKLDGHGQLVDDN